MSAIRSTLRLSSPLKCESPFLLAVYLLPHLDEYPRGNARMAPDAPSLRGHSIGADFSIHIHMIAAAYYN